MSFFSDLDLTKTFNLNLSNHLDISQPIYGILFSVTKFFNNYNVTLSNYAFTDPSYSMCRPNETIIHNNINNNVLIGNYYVKVYNQFIDVNDIYILDTSYCTLETMLDVSLNEVSAQDISMQFFVDSINSLCSDLKIIQGINPSPAVHISLPEISIPAVETPLAYYTTEQMLGINPINPITPLYMPLAPVVPIFEISFNLVDTSGILMDISNNTLDVSSVQFDVSSVQFDVSGIIENNINNTFYT